MSLSTMVVKVGSSSLTRRDGSLNTAIIKALAVQIATIHKQGKRVIIVSSGAVAAGLRPLGWATRPTEMVALQVAASVGQSLAMRAWSEAFTPHNITVGQVLLVSDDFTSRHRYLNARSTLTRMIELGVIPIVNENDAIADDELRLGDNDRVAALTASMINLPADSITVSSLALLTDVDGLYDGPPGEGYPLIPVVHDINDLSTRHFGASGSGVGSGGMASKLEAARIATFSGIPTVIANANAKNVLINVANNTGIGTMFPPSRTTQPDAARLWRVFAKQPVGSLMVDDGCVAALSDTGASLLPVGILEVTGNFRAGDTVVIYDRYGQVIARGLVATDSDIIRAQLAHPAAHNHAVVHRDNLMVLT